MSSNVLNETMLKFGAPETCIHTYSSWLVLLRPAQVTLGALVLVAREPVTSFSRLSEAGFTELARVTRDVELVLSHLFHYDKLNYLMLMMVDPHVHFHVIPRYAAERRYGGTVFFDAAWPGAPDLAQNNSMNEKDFSRLGDDLRSAWPDRGNS